GRYDEAGVFLDGLPFPTAVMAWKDGVLVCAAPDILFARDTDGDGKADQVEKLFTGFPTEKYQARVNGLGLGLDGWIDGANGLLGGAIVGFPNSLFAGAQKPEPLNIRNRDFRISLKTGSLELASGLSQQGRVRDDWNNWFGCDNTRPLLHYPIPEYYA